MTFFFVWSRKSDFVTEDPRFCPGVEPHPAATYLRYHGYAICFLSILFRYFSTSLAPQFKVFTHLRPFRRCLEPENLH